MRADVRCKRANLCDANTHTRIHICMHAWSHKLYILHFTFHLTFFTFTLTVLPTHFVHVAHALLPFPLPLRLHCVAHICATLLCLHNLYYTSSCILFQSASCATIFLYGCYRCFCFCCSHSLHTFPFHELNWKREFALLNYLLNQCTRRSRLPLAGGLLECSSNITHHLMLLKLHAFARGNALT